MTCREFEDAMAVQFGAADWDQLHDLIVKENWDLLSPSAFRDHLASCRDCPSSLYQFVQTRGMLDYREQPCFHVAYYSADVPERCLESRHGTYSIITDRARGEGIVIGCCPWCGIALPTGVQ